MATSTTNYGFRKPGASDVINVDTDLNNTYDFLDSKIKEIEDTENAVESSLLSRSKLELRTADLVLTNNVDNTILQLNGGAILPVGQLNLDLWFTVRHNADVPDSLTLSFLSSQIRDWVGQYGPTLTSESGTSTYQFFGTTLTLSNLKATNTSAGGLLYHARVGATAIDPSSTIDVRLRPVNSVDCTLKNLTCEWTVR